MIDNTRIRELACQHGFKFKEQPCGEHDLNPYVFDFARAVAADVLEAVIEKYGGCFVLGDELQEIADECRDQIESNP